MILQSHSWAYIRREKTIIQKDTCTPVSIEALFTIARTQKQPKCPSTDEWIKKLWYIYKGILLSHKKERKNAIYSNVDGPRDCHTEVCEVSQTEKDTYHMISLICGIQKNGTNEPIYKTEIESQMQKTNLWFPREKGSVGGINWEIGIDIYTLLYIKQITNKNLLYSTGNSTQYSAMTYVGIESKKEWIYVYV